MRSKVLITGGSGFIGTHLIGYLLANGFQVAVLDLKPLRQDIDRSQVEMFRGDVRDQALVKKALIGVDAVVHLAAMVSVPLCEENPVLSYETNELATVQLCEFIHQEQVRSKKRLHLLFASSSAVYGDGPLGGNPNLQIARSEMEPLGDQKSHYAAQKLASEKAISLFSKSYGFDASVFRLFNVFGPGQDDSSPYSGVITLFKKRLVQGEKLVLFGGGKQTRDFVHVSDVVRAFVQVISGAGVSAEAKLGNPINIGRGESVSIRKLAEEMCLDFGFKEEDFSRLISSGPERQGDVLHSLASIERAKKWIGFNPELGLKAGLLSLLEEGAR